MGAVGLERGFALATGVILVILGALGALGSPLVGRAEDTGIVVTGFGHDLVHLVLGALYLHAGLALDRRQRAWTLVSLGIVVLLTGLLSLVTPDLFGLYDAPTSGFDQLGHLLLGIASIVIGWMGRGVERREVGRAASRPLRG